MTTHPDRTTTKGSESNRQRLPQKGYSETQATGHRHVALCSETKAVSGELPHPSLEQHVGGFSGAKLICFQNHQAAHICMLLHFFRFPVAAPATSAGNHLGWVSAAPVL